MPRREKPDAVDQLDEPEPDAPPPPRRSKKKPAHDFSGGSFRQHEGIPVRHRTGLGLVKTRLIRKRRLSNGRRRAMNSIGSLRRGVSL